MIMRTAPKPSTDEGKHIRQELRDLLETTAMQQTQSSVERWHPEASFVHISLAHGAPRGTTHRAHSDQTMVTQRTGKNPPQRAAITSEITLPVQLKVSGTMGPTGRAKTSYTMEAATRITMSSTPGARRSTQPKPRCLQTAGVHKKNPTNAIPSALSRTAEHCQIF
jgi:hypothetical protein